MAAKVALDKNSPCSAETLYKRQILVGSWILYSFFLLLLALAAGVSFRVADSDKETYEMSIFFIVLLFITVTIGAYVLVTM
jgi:hypothetical protein